MLFRSAIRRHLIHHPLVNTLVSLTGNARACVFTEPMWGIPHNLYAAYISIYMRDLGLKDSQIGMVASIGLFFQILAAMFSGIITDKLGRKRATLIYDILSWSVPCLIWAVAQNFTYFVIAAIVNSLWRVTMNSWTLLMVEDTDPELLVDIYSWVYISGQLAAFFAPLAALLIGTFTLVPTMRGLYIFAFVLMTAKFLVLNHYVHETEQGKVRMRETRNQSLFIMFGEYRAVIGKVLKSPSTLYTVGIMLVMGASQLVTSTFWAILVNEKLNIPDRHLGYFVLARSATMLLFFFLAMPRIRNLRFRNPMIVGFAGFAASQLLLISIPPDNYILLLVSILIEACAIATLGTQVDRMAVVTVEAKERARIMAIVYVVVILCTTPFGWIAGTLSEINRNLPFILNLVLFAIGILLTFFAARRPANAAPLESEALGSS
jgi:MFS family permease